MALPEPRKEYNFPKAELHCHLDGTYELDTIIEMAKERNKELPAYDSIMLSRLLCNLKRCESLDEYLEIFRYVVPTFAGDLERIERLAIEAMKIKARYGVRYIELRYAPHLLLDEDSQKKGITLSQVVEAVNSGIQKGSEEVMKTMNVEIVGRTILCTMIFKPEWSMEVVELCKEFKGKGVVGFDVAGAGDKDGNMIAQHQTAYQFCKEHGIGRTAHAGEKGSSNEVKVAVDKLSVQRIGHGYKVLEDEELYQNCIKQGIHFEVCPLSSYLTASVDTDMRLHPAVRFAKDKLSFSINTDDPGVQQSCIDDEYEICAKSFHLTMDQMRKTNIDALKAAFVDEETKQRLISEFEEQYRNLIPPSQCTQF